MTSRSSSLSVKDVEHGTILPTNNSNTNNSIQSGNSSTTGQQQRQHREQRRAERAAARANDPDDAKKRRGPRRTLTSLSSANMNTLIVHPFFMLFAGMLLVSCCISFFLVFSHPEAVPVASGGGGGGGGGGDWKAPKIPPKPPAAGEGAAGYHRLSDAQQREAIMHGYNKDKVIGDTVADAVVARAAQEEATDDDEVEDGDKDGSGDTGGGDRNDDDTEQDDNPQPEDVDPLGIIKNKKKKGPAKKRANHIPKLTPTNYHVQPFDSGATTTVNPPHLVPKFAPLPAFNEIDNKDVLIEELVHQNKPTIAGILAFLNEYQKKLHAMHKKNSELQSAKNTGQQIDEMFLIQSYFNLTMQEIDPLENAYRGRTIFPIRDDDSIYISLAAFREHLLGKSLMSAFDKAKHPDKLFFGIVVQNCYGLDGVVCRTGVEVIGKNKQGNPITSISPKPPDANGVEEFCTTPAYTKYCESGQIRVMYVHDTDALGPQTARFYASKLWGGETYFMQMDAHLEFAPEWDQYYIDEARACKNYPKAVLSAYPPGFKNYDGEYKGGTPGARLCVCGFSTSPVENHILRISMGGNTPHDATCPTQIPFIAAGFFFAHAEFLQDVPFDPYAPWCFMGEEIALSVRAWTMGWDIYAPRKNMIAHQYRPGRLGLPKFWESVGRDSGRAGLNTRLQKHVLRRVKYMIGYTTDSEEMLQKDGDTISLTNFEHYSMGHVRSLEDYLEFTGIDVIEQKCPSMGWCQHSELE